MSEGGGGGYDFSQKLNGPLNKGGTLSKQLGTSPDQHSSAIGSSLFDKLAKQAGVEPPVQGNADVTLSRTGPQQELLEFPVAEDPFSKLQSQGLEEIDTSRDIQELGKLNTDNPIFHELMSQPTRTSSIIAEGNINLATIAPNDHDAIDPRIAYISEGMKNGDLSLLQIGDDETRRSYDYVTNNKQQVVARISEKGVVEIPAEIPLSSIEAEIWYDAKSEHHERAEEYAQQLKVSDPPLITLQGPTEPGGKFHLVHGHHRFEAAQVGGRDKINGWVTLMSNRAGPLIIDRDMLEQPNPQADAMRAKVEEAAKAASDEKKKLEDAAFLRQQLEAKAAQDAFDLENGITPEFRAKLDQEKIEEVERQLRLAQQVQEEESASQQYVDEHLSEYQGPFTDSPAGSTESDAATWLNPNNNYPDSYRQQSQPARVSTQPTPSEEGIWGKIRQKENERLKYVIDNAQNFPTVEEAPDTERWTSPRTIAARKAAAETGQPVLTEKQRKAAEDKRIKEEWKAEKEADDAKRRAANDKWEADRKAKKAAEEAKRIADNDAWQAEKEAKKLAEDDARLRAAKEWLAEQDAKRRANKARQGGANGDSGDAADAEGQSRGNGRADAGSQGGQEAGERNQGPGLRQKAGAVLGGLTGLFSRKENNTAIDDSPGNYSSDQDEDEPVIQTYTKQDKQDARQDSTDDQAGAGSGEYYYEYDQDTPVQPDMTPPPQPSLPPIPRFDLEQSLRDGAQIMTKSLSELLEQRGALIDAGESLGNDETERARLILESQQRLEQKIYAEYAREQERQAAQQNQNT